MFRSGGVYRFIVRSLGWGQIFAAIIILCVSTLNGVLLPFGAMTVVLLLVPALFLAVPALSPPVLSRPAGIFGVVGAILLLGLLVIGPSAGAWLMRDRLDDVVMAVVISPALLALYTCSLLLPVSGFFAIVRPQTDPEEEEDPDLPPELRMIADPVRPTLVAEALVLRLSAAVLIGLVGTVTFWRLTGWPAAAFFLPEVPMLGLLLALAALTVLAAPLPIRRTSPIFHPTVIMLPIKVAIFGALGLALYHLMPVVGLRWPNVIASLLAESGFAIGLVVTVTLVTLAGLNFYADVQDDAKAAIPTELRNPDQETKILIDQHEELPAVPTGSKPRQRGDALPDIGFAMKMYIVADWTIMKIFGLCLLGMAWMIHIQPVDYMEPLAPILYGIAPQTMKYVYAGWGMALILAFLLPRSLVRPRSVVGGGLKAAVLLGLALLILPAFTTLIDLHVHRDYRGVLHATLPKLFKSVAGIAVLSTVVIAFFRQLSGIPELDHQGRKVLRYSDDDLRSIRSARMEH
ncbi:hypothetical protein [Jannaschia aquimarina]|uniref:Uncharacterized protein n=1 Tax=Jannaschia aquimarina TaxID=935700 RepID=A0A0D1DDZ7_9RHOB|nr:hypothetical protein [Jannaschia aquimarina]KIT18183.1 hypothetical protein jaqu_00460 [Jannaschia aquimarina]SNT40337.1 hypothetical protein SAMN05421775_11549 [Jannaschia aquimarina]